MPNICTLDYSPAIETLVFQVPYVTELHVSSIFVYAQSGVCAQTWGHKKENDIWYLGKKKEQKGLEER